ncbi:MAG: hypothetical protein EZS28_028391, partial [Streblomastix strix]
MTSQFNKKQIVDVGKLLGYDLSHMNNVNGRNTIQHYLRQYGVPGSYAYSDSLRQRITSTIQYRQQHPPPVRRRKKKPQEIRQELIDHENLRYFHKRNDQDYQNELQQFKQQHKPRRKTENQQVDVSITTLFDPQQAIDNQWAEITILNDIPQQKHKNNFDQYERQDINNDVQQRSIQMQQNEKKFFQERYRKIHHEFNNLTDLELRTFKLLDEEITEDIRRLDQYMRFREIEFEDTDALMLSEPFNQALFRHEVQRFRSRYPKETTDKSYSRRQSNDFEPTRHYYNNNIVSQQDIENHIRRVGELELQMNNFIIAFDFGYTVEKVKYDEDQAQIVTYSTRQPHSNIQNTLNIEQQITSKEKLEQFIQYLPAKTIEDQERTLENTKTRFIAIVSMEVVVYRARSGGAAPAHLQKFFKRQEVKFVDNKNYRNNCLFDALSFISLPDIQTKRRPTDSRVAEGRRLMKLFNSAIGNEQIKNFEEFCKNYHRFNLASEGKQLANIFNINICVYAYLHLDFDEEPTQEVEIQPKLNSKGNRIHRKKQENIKEKKYDNYFLDFVIKPDEKIITMNDNKNKHKQLEIQTENMIKTILPHADDDHFVFEAIGEKLNNCLDQLGDPVKAKEIKQRLINEDAMKIQNSFVDYYNQTISDRMSTLNRVPLYNYEKADKRPDYCKKEPWKLTEEEKICVDAYKKEHQYQERTGLAINIAKCPFLAIVDIDINKKLEKSERTAITEEILSKIEDSKLNVGLVETAHGGLHIYCNTGCICLDNNSMVAVISNEKYAVDIFACAYPENDMQSWDQLRKKYDEKVDHNDENKIRKLRNVVLPFSKIKDKSHDKISHRSIATSEILEYNQLNQIYGMKNLNSLADVFGSLNFDISVIRYKRKAYREIQENADNTDLTYEQAFILINGLENVIVHNYKSDRDNNQASLFTLFLSINSLRKIPEVDEAVMNEIFDSVRELPGLTVKTRENFDSKRKQLQSKSSSPYQLSSLVKNINLIYYKENFLPTLIKKVDSKYSHRQISVNIDESNAINEEPRDFNILLVHFRDKFHFLYISDTQALTGLAYCPVCKLHAVKVNDKHGNWNRDLRKHIEQCKQNK